MIAEPLYQSASTGIPLDAGQTRYDQWIENVTLWGQKLVQQAVEQSQAQHPVDYTPLSFSSGYAELKRVSCQSLPAVPDMRYEKKMPPCRPDGVCTIGLAGVELTLNMYERAGIPLKLPIEQALIQLHAWAAREVETDSNSPWPYVVSALDHEYMLYADLTISHYQKQRQSITQLTTQLRNISVEQLTSPVYSAWQAVDKQPLIRKTLCLPLLGLTSRCLNYECYRAARNRWNAIHVQSVEHAKTSAAEWLQIISYCREQTPGYTQYRLQHELLSELTDASEYLCEVVQLLEKRQHSVDDLVQGLRFPRRSAETETTVPVDQADQDAQQLIADLKRLSHQLVQYVHCQCIVSGDVPAAECDHCVDCQANNIHPLLEQINTLLQLQQDGSVPIESAELVLQHEESLEQFVNHYQEWYMSRSVGIWQAAQQPVIVLTQVLCRLPDRDWPEFQKWLHMLHGTQKLFPNGVLTKLTEPGMPARCLTELFQCCSKRDQLLQQRFRIYCRTAFYTLIDQIRDLYEAGPDTFVQLITHQLEDIEKLLQQRWRQWMVEEKQALQNMFESHDLQRVLSFFSGGEEQYRPVVDQIQQRVKQVPPPTPAGITQLLHNFVATVPSIQQCRHIKVVFDGPLLAQVQRSWTDFQRWAVVMERAAKHMYLELPPDLQKALNDQTCIMHSSEHPVSWNEIALWVIRVSVLYQWSDTVVVQTIAPLHSNNNEKQ